MTAALVPQRKPRPAPEKKVVEAVARHEAPAPVQAPVMERGENRPTQRVTKAEAGIASLAASGVNFTSGRHVGVGDVFPSGEKLISVDPAIGEIITSRRRIVVSDKNPLPEPPASSVKAGNESHG
ncbi:MAG: hypothetical protein EPN79_11340 [Burkholderiaceae bacterium]|nr:MAG: hypothetical protein EPN79_11340 [Burkholderiaceae bacterium]TBR76722.1 MAG: hypothetical protein EPN64_05730 [Burkholderiaceae bacterium]